MSSIYVCLLTYNRFDYAAETLRSTLDNITGVDSVSVHIADDGSPNDYRERLVELAAGYAFVQGVTVTNSERGGYGRNVNLATQVIHSFDTRYVLMLEDDWRLTRELDLSLLTRAIDHSDGLIACVRLGYLSFTQGLRGHLSAVGPEWHKYLIFDPNSEEPHVFAGHPRFESVEFQKRVGPWPVGLEPGATEFAVCHNDLARMGVAWPMDLIHPTVNPLYAHIGARRSTDPEVVGAASDSVPA